MCTNAMPDEIEMAETAPGFWELWRRPQRVHSETFFDSLAGQSSKRRYFFEDKGWYAVMILFTAPAIAALLRDLFQ